MPGLNADLRRRVAEECATDRMLIGALHPEARVECMPEGYRYPHDSAKADCVFIAMEPSLLGAKPYKGTAKAGNTPNFLSSRRDFVLHLFIRRHVLKGRYFITDLAKGAMITDLAAESCIGRWIRWYSLLIDELGTMVHSKTRLFALGDRAFGAIYYSNTQARLGLEARVKKLTHYANRFPQASKSGLQETEKEYEDFDLQGFAQEVLEDQGLDAETIRHVSATVKELNRADLLLLARWKEELASG
jgi:hypothetical protein